VSLSLISAIVRTNPLCLFLIALILLPLATGCGRFVFKPSPQPQTISISPQQQQALAQRTQQFQHRANNLDQDNQELGSLLAQSRQHVKLLEDQVGATQTQLRDTADQLAAAMADNGNLRSRTTALAASVQKRAGAEIRANNSLLRNLSITNLPGIHVRQDGDVIRVEIPGEQLFHYGTAQLKQGADGLIRTVASDLLRNYPQQLIGIEGHTDRSSGGAGQSQSGHHLAISQAMAVYETMTRSVGAPPKQLFVIGHGDNHPIVSNATEAGRTRNRRVELVIYPETIRR